MMKTKRLSNEELGEVWEAAQLHLKEEGDLCEEEIVAHSILMEIVERRQADEGGEVRRCAETDVLNEAAGIIDELKEYYDEAFLPPVDMKRVREVLGKAGLSLARVSAQIYRQALTRASELLEHEAKDRRKEGE